MKQVLSKAQVNDNLNQIKKGVSVCYSITYNRYTDEPTFYIWFRGKGIIVAQGKKIFFHSFTDELREDEPALYSFRGLVYTDYVTKVKWSSRYNKDRKETAEKILKACGLLNEKKLKPVTPEQRLRELEYNNLVPIYKMMLDVDLINADLETKYKKDYWGNEKTHEPFMALVVRHTKGSFSIPIDNYPEEVQNIFFNALNLPVTSKLKTA